MSEMGYDAMRMDDLITGSNMKKEETVTICAECGELVEEITYTVRDGWDGLSKCTGCGQVEGDTEEITIEEYEQRL